MPFISNTAGGYSFYKDAKFRRLTRKPCDGFMGTSIEYGSDDFKTFEEIITFFERLGGQ